MSFHDFYDLSKNPYVLAPMAGITDKAMRLMCRSYGCGLQYTEMVSAKALTFQNPRTYSLFDLTDEAPGILVQLFGSEPAVMAEGARLAVAHGAKALDVNMGCPVPKVANYGEGSGLLRTPQIAAEIIRAMTHAVDVPVSAKIRIGWDRPDPQITDFAKRLEDAGAAMIAVHGRTRQQYYSGAADWETITRVVEAVQVPVIANGDVWSVDDAARLIAQSGAAAVMIGRGALGRPWFFKQLTDPHAHDIAPTLEERWDILRRHAALACFYKGEDIAMREMRKHMGWYVKGLPHAAMLRRESDQLRTLGDLDALLAKVLT